MNQNDPTKSLMMEAFPSPEPGDALTERIDQLPVGPTQPVFFRMPRRTSLIAVGSAFAAAAGLAAVVVLTGTPRMALADEILQGATNIHGHILTYIVAPDGKRTLADECWLEADRARTISHEANGIDQLLDLPKNLDVTWNPHIQAFVFRDSDLRMHFALGRAFMTGDLTALRSIPGFEKLPKKTGRGEFDGKPADTLELDSGGGKWTAFADPETHRTIGIRMFHKEWIPGTHRATVMKGRGIDVSEDEHMVEREAVIDEQVADPKVFDPVFKIDGVEVNAVTKREAVRESLSHSLATYNSPSGPVVIRNVSMNAHGDVFVLWSGGNGDYGHNVIPVTVRDGTGGAYAKCWFVAHQVVPGNWPGFVFDGKPLEGAWFAHIDGPVASGPVTIGFKKEFEPIRKLAFRHTQRPTLVTGPIPDYMMFMSMPVIATSMERDRNEVAAEYFTQTAPDYTRAEALWRKVIAENEPSGQPQWASSHYELGFCLEHERKFTEAIAELTLAKKLALEQGRYQAGDADRELRLTKRAAGSIR